MAAGSSDGSAYVWDLNEQNTLFKMVRACFAQYRSKGICANWIDLQGDGDKKFRYQRPTYSSDFDEGSCHSNPICGICSLMKSGASIGNIRVVLDIYR